MRTPKVTIAKTIKPNNNITTSDKTFPDRIALKIVFSKNTFDN
jgi:hypothetical protein